MVLPGLPEEAPLAHEAAGDGAAVDAERSAGGSGGGGRLLPARVRRRAARVRGGGAREPRGLSGRVDQR